MSVKITRREALVSGAAFVGMTLGTNCTKLSEKDEISFSEKSWWPPGPDKDLVKDLTPGSTPIRLACMSTQTMLNYPEKRSITETARYIRDQGYTSANSSYAMGTRNKWLDASESEITELKKACTDYDVELFDTMIWTNLLHPDEKTRQKNLKYVTENVEAADRIGCRMVTGATGSRDPDFYIGMHPDNWTRETWNVTIDSIRQILRDTSGCTTALGMEAVVTTNLDSPLAHKRLMEDVGDPRCKVCLDPTNMLNLERFYRTGELLDDCFDMLGENILGCDGKDEIIERDRMLLHLTEAVPGDGIMDYETYLVRLSRMEWPRTLLLEHMKAEDYPRAKAFVEQMAAQVGITIHS